MKKILLFLIGFYQKNVSPLLKPRCRFYPTCSVYALEAIEVHGALKGTYLAVRRVLRCHPFHKGGFDPVPPKEEKQSGSFQTKRSFWRKS